MWKADTELLSPHIEKFRILEHGRPMTNAAVFRRWRGDNGFGDFFSGVLAASAFPAYFWECAPVSISTLGRAFEFVLVYSSALAGVHADPGPFHSCFPNSAPDQTVVTFTNLGGDAVLVSPRPDAAATPWPHLAEFVRAAPMQRQRELWMRTAEAALENIGDAPLWISTSGLGVYWLHVRLDTWPKYYTFEPYRRIV